MTGIAKCVDCGRKLPRNGWPYPVCPACNDRYDAEIDREARRIGAFKRSCVRTLAMPPG